MIKDTYLSIDMDFWSHTYNYTNLKKFMKKVQDTGIKPVVVKYHHELVKHISGMEGVTRILNMDYHADIADISVCREHEFNEGTWGNYIRLTNNDEFVWHYPLKSCVSMETGYCHGGSDNPFHKRNQGLYNWNHITKKYGVVPEIEFSRVGGIGICLSPNWNKRCNVLYYVDLLTELGFIDSKLAERLLSPTNESLKEKQEFRQLNKKFLYSKERKT